MTLARLTEGGSGAYGGSTVCAVTGMKNHGECLPEGEVLGLPILNAVSLNPVRVFHTLECCVVRETLVCTYVSDVAFVSP